MKSTPVSWISRVGPVIGLLMLPGVLAGQTGAEVTSDDRPSRTNAVPAIGGYPDTPVVRIAVPHDADAESPEQRSIWRAVTREALTHYLTRGYDVVGFRRGTTTDLPYYDLASRGA